MGRKSDRMTSLVGVWGQRPDPWEFRSRENGADCLHDGRKVADIDYRPRRHDWLLRYPPERWTAPSRRAVEVLCRAIHHRLAGTARQLPAPAAPQPTLLNTQRPGRWWPRLGRARAWGGAVLGAYVFLRIMWSIVR